MRFNEILESLLTSKALGGHSEVPFACDVFDNWMKDITIYRKHINESYVKSGVIEPGLRKIQIALEDDIKNLSRFAKVDPETKEYVDACIERLEKVKEFTRDLKWI
jgi:hypothetical protein